MSNNTKRAAKALQKRAGIRYTLALQCILDIRSSPELTGQLLWAPGSPSEKLVEVALQNWDFE